MVVDAGSHVSPWLMSVCSSLGIGDRRWARVRHLSLSLFFLMELLTILNGVGKNEKDQSGRVELPAEILRESWVTGVGARMKESG